MSLLQQCYALTCYTVIHAGNDNLHLLTAGKRRHRLRIDLADFDGFSHYAEYDNFKVDSASAGYKLVSVGTYRGTAGLYS